MKKSSEFLRRLCVFLLPLLLLSGCEDSFYNHAFTRTETTWGGKHTVNQTSDGATRTIQYSGKVVLDQGRVQHLSPGCVIHITEKKSGKKTVAEVREEKGVPVLWMQTDGNFRLANAGEKAWLEQFLRSMENPVSDRATVESAIKKRMENPEDGDFLVPLRKLSFGDEKAALLKNVVKSARLTPQQQVAVIHACFEHVSFSSDKVSVLLALMKCPDFSPAAKEAVRARVDELSFDSDKITVLKALAAK